MSLIEVKAKEVINPEGEVILLERPITINTSNILYIEATHYDYINPKEINGTCGLGYRYDWTQEKEIYTMNWTEEITINLINGTKIKVVEPYISEFTKKIPVLKLTPGAD